MPLAEDVDYLISKENVGCVINMCREYGGPTEQYSEYAIEHIWLPTPDLSEPRMDDINCAISYIEDFRVRCPGERVFIHCKGGRGRAVTVALCYLVSKGFRAEDAMALIKSKRPVAASSVLHSEVVKSFIARKYSIIYDLRKAEDF